MEINIEKQSQKIALIAALLAVCCFLAYYFHAVLGICTVFTHFFYVPIILASLWWKRKGLAVALFFALLLIFSHYFLQDGAVTANDYFRALMFVVIGFVVALLSERIANREEALQETSDYLENLINYANAPIIVWDPEKRINLFNHAFEHLTGYKGEEVIGKKLDILFPETSRGESLSKIENTLKGEFWESVEIPILCKDGDTKIALWNSANIYAQDGTTVISTIAQGQEITGYRLTQEGLKESEERYRSLVESTEDSIYLLDRNCTYLFMNKEHLSRIGLTAKKSHR